MTAVHTITDQFQVLLCMPATRVYDTGTMHTLLYIPGVSSVEEEHTRRLVPDRTVRYRTVRYRTVRYRTVQHRRALLHYCCALPYHTVPYTTPRAVLCPHGTVSFVVFKVYP